MKSFSQMTSFLEADEELKESANPEKVSEVTGGLVKATGNLLEAIMVKKEAAEPSNNQTGNVTVNVDASNITMSSSSIKKVFVSTQAFKRNFYVFAPTSCVLSCCRSSLPTSSNHFPGRYYLFNHTFLYLVHG